MRQTFAQRVYAVVLKIPKGKVMTYQEVAKAIHHKKAARAVGNALNKNPRLRDIPCHRVVRSDGNLGGYARGKVRKKYLLGKEGVVIQNGKIDLSIYQHSVI